MRRLTPLPPLPPVSPSAHPSGRGGSINFHPDFMRIVNRLPAVSNWFNFLTHTLPNFMMGSLDQDNPLDRLRLAVIDTICELQPRIARTDFGPAKVELLWDPSVKKVVGAPLKFPAIVFDRKEDYQRFIALLCERFEITEDPLVGFAFETNPSYIAHRLSGDPKLLQSLVKRLIVPVLCHEPIGDQLAPEGLRRYWSQRAADPLYGLRTIDVDLLISSLAAFIGMETESHDALDTINIAREQLYLPLAMYGFYQRDIAVFSKLFGLNKDAPFTIEDAGQACANLIYQLTADSPRATNAELALLLMGCQDLGQMHTELAKLFPEIVPPFVAEPALVANGPLVELLGEPQTGRLVEVLDRGDWKQATDGLDDATERLLGALKIDRPRVGMDGVARVAEPELDDLAALASEMGITIQQVGRSVIIDLGFAKIRVQSSQPLNPVTLLSLLADLDQIVGGISEITEPTPIFVEARLPAGAAGSFEDALRDFEGGAVGKVRGESEKGEDQIARFQAILEGSSDTDLLAAFHELERERIRRSKEGVGPIVATTRLDDAGRAFDDLLAIFDRPTAVASPRIADLQAQEIAMARRLWPQGLFHERLVAVAQRMKEEEGDQEFEEYLGFVINNFKIVSEYCTRWPSVYQFDGRQISSLWQTAHWAAQAMQPLVLANNIRNDYPAIATDLVNLALDYFEQIARTQFDRTGFDIANLQIVQRPEAGNSRIIVSW